MVTEGTFCNQQYQHNPFSLYPLTWCLRVIEAVAGFQTNPFSVAAHVPSTGGWKPLSAAGALMASQSFESARRASSTGATMLGSKVDRMTWGDPGPDAAGFSRRVWLLLHVRRRRLAGHPHSLPHGAQVTGAVMSVARHLSVLWSRKVARAYNAAWTAIREARLPSQYQPLAQDACSALADLNLQLRKRANSRWRKTVLYTAVILLGLTILAVYSGGHGLLPSVYLRLRTHRDRPHQKTSTLRQSCEIRSRAWST